ncbi:MAG TPA: FtsX-like permease family protein [Sedimentisphaerales bacterium]|nr:FtsX-like permease family protein [Sedimentisphaerales bacterium]
MLKLFLWLRYLRKKKIVFLSIAAVALSSALLIVVSSLFTSFINAFEQSAVEAMGDIVLDPPIRFAKYQLFIERLEQVGQVKAATATLSGQGLLHLPQGNVRAVKLLGIEPESRAEVTGFKQFLYTQKDLPQVPSLEVPGSPESVGGFVGIGVVAEPDEKTDEYDFAAVEKMVGRQVVLTTGAVLRAQENESTGAQFTRKTVKLTIVDIVFTGVYELDKSYVYLPIERLQKILYPNEDGQVADQIQIKVASDAGTDSALAQIRGVWGDFADKQLDWSPYLINETTIITAKEMQSPLVAAFKKQMGILLLIFGVVSFTVVLLVFCILYMIVTIKQKDIAIIKSCGATNSSVALIFVSFGAFVGIVGSGMGAIMGYIVTRNINTIEEWIRIIFGLKLWKSSVYMFSKIPNEVNWDSALPIILSAVVAASLGALIPAIIAVKTRPINILRYE